MDFKDVMISVAIIAIGIFAFLGLADSINSNWGTSIASDFSSDYDNIRIGLVGNITEQSGTLAQSGLPEEGQAVGTAEESFSRRALRIMGVIPQLVQMPVKLIGTAGSSLGLPPFITLIGQSVFVFSFFITLAYLFITGARRLIGR